MIEIVRFVNSEPAHTLIGLGLVVLVLFIASNLRWDGYEMPVGLEEDEDGD